MNSRTSPATAATFDLAEGVVWDDRAGLVRWVDIREGRVLAGTLSGDEIETVDDRHLGQTVGAVALAEDGGLLVAAARGLATISPDGQVSFGPDLSSVVAPDGRIPWRLNDGIVDPQGRFIVGTLALDETPTANDGESSGPCEVLLRVSPDGQVETLRTGMGMSNGLGFSPDGKILYLIDTLSGTLSRHSYGGSHGDGDFDVNEPWVTVFDDFPSYADGMTVDADGDLWVALWGGSRVSRYASDGRHIGDIAVNATQPTCAGFIGPSLNRLAITSARKDLTEVTDDSGSLFVGDVNAIGKLEYRWAGSTAAPYWI
jgi:sugar lactone lactonase YvrE